jgi:hypothetical protein
MAVVITISEKLFVGIFINPARLDFPWSTWISVAVRTIFGHQKSANSGPKRVRSLSRRKIHAPTQFFSISDPREFPVL